MLIENKLPCAGFNVFTVISSGTGFDEEAALLGAGREFALMKTASGKVSVGNIIPIW